MKKTLRENKKNNTFAELFQFKLLKNKAKQNARLDNNCDCGVPPTCKQTLFHH